MIENRRDVAAHLGLFDGTGVFWSIPGKMSAWWTPVVEKDSHPDCIEVTLFPRWIAPSMTNWPLLRGRRQTR